MKRFVAIILAALILLSVYIAVPVFASEVKYEKGKVVTLDFLAPDIDRPFTAFEGLLTFSGKLTIDKESVVFPHIKDTAYRVYDDSVLFDSTNLNNYDITSDSVFMSASFTVNEDVETLPAECVIDDIYYIDGTSFIVPEKVTLPYKLTAVAREEIPETTESTQATAESTSVQETTSATEPTSETVKPTTPTVKPKKKVTKKTNTIKVSVKTKSFKAKKLKKKSYTFKAVTVKKAVGKVSYQKYKSGFTKTIYKKISVNSKTGKIKIAKGKYRKGTYKIKIKVSAKGNTKYKSKNIIATVKIKVK